MKIWQESKRLVGVLLAVLGLAGIADGVVAWQNFAVYEAYKEFRTALFGVLPFSVNQYLQDYIVLSLVISSAVWRDSRYRAMMEDGAPIWTLVLLHQLVLFFVWPLFVPSAIKAFVIWVPLAIRGDIRVAVEQEWRNSGLEEYYENQESSSDLDLHMACRRKFENSLTEKFGSQWEDWKEYRRAGRFVANCIVVLAIFVCVLFLFSDFADKVF